MKTTLCIAGLVLSQTVHALEPYDCETAAHKLRREASDLEDAASHAASASGSDRADAEARMRTTASDVLGYADRVRRDCGAARSVGVPPGAVLGAIRSHLLLRFGSTDVVRARIAAIDAQLQTLAASHARVQPVDYRMTLAVAELIYNAEQ